MLKPSVSGKASRRGPQPFGRAGTHHDDGNGRAARESQRRLARLLRAARMPLTLVIIALYLAAAAGIVSGLLFGTLDFWFWLTRSRSPVAGVSAPFISFFGGIAGIFTARILSVVNEKLQESAQRLEPRK